MRSARKSAGLAIKELAARLGVRPGRLVAWESGQRQPPLKYLLEVASVCGVDLGWILTGERKPQAPWEAHLARLEEEVRALRALVGAIAERPPRYPTSSGPVGAEQLASFVGDLDVERAARDLMPALLAVLPRVSRTQTRHLEAALVHALRTALPALLADLLARLQREPVAAEP